MNDDPLEIPPFLQRKPGETVPDFKDAPPLEQPFKIAKAVVDPELAAKASRRYKRKRERETAAAALHGYLKREKVFTFHMVKVQFPELEEWALRATLRSMRKNHVLELNGKTYTKV